MNLEAQQIFTAKYIAIGDTINGKREPHAAIRHIIRMLIEQSKELSDWVARDLEYDPRSVAVGMVLASAYTDMVMLATFETLENKSEDANNLVMIMRSILIDFIAFNLLEEET